MPEHVVLSDGKIIPILGFGTNTVNEDHVKWAIDAGYRMFDCAEIYGTQEAIGKAIKAKVDEGKIKRDDIYITSKLWHNHHRSDLVRPSIEKTIKELGVEYLDLFLIHGPTAWKAEDEVTPDDKEEDMLSNIDYVDTWKDMEKLVDAGLTKSIGVSNFSKDQLQRILNNCKIKPVMNQVESHPYLKQAKLLEYCKSKGIAMTAYSPLGAGSGNSPTKNDAIKKIAEKHHKSVYQVLIRYQIERGVVVIPKSTKKSHIESNFNVFNFELDEDDMKTINEITTTVSYFGNVDY